MPWVMHRVWDDIYKEWYVIPRKHDHITRKQFYRFFKKYNIEPEDRSTWKWPGLLIKDVFLTWDWSVGFKIIHRSGVDERLDGSLPEVVIAYIKHDMMRTLMNNPDMKSGHFIKQYFIFSIKHLFI